MKKSLLALAVLGAFAGTASAQSSVTIYGVVDMSIAKDNCGAPSVCAVNTGTPTGKAWTMQQSTTSRLGFRGNEDLGGGLSAQFQIEHRFNPDTGAQNQTPFWNGRSYVQLSSAAAGAVYLGREYTPAFWVQLKSDPFGNDGVGQTGVGITWAGFYTPDSASGVTTSPQAAWPAGGSARSSNTVGYKSPSLGGLTVNAAVSLSESTGQGRDNGFNVEYAAGPIYAALGYEKVSKGASDGRGVTNLALHYNLGFIKPIFYYAASKAGSTLAGDSYDDNKVYVLAATAPLGNGVLKFGFSRIKFENAPAVNGENKHTKLGLGYNYNLSARTNLYADFGSANGRAANGTKGDRNTAYALGLRHTF